MPRQRTQSLSLPSDPITPPEEFWKQPTCIYGRKAIGKTTIASLVIPEMLPEGKSVLNMRFEAYRANLEILQVPQPGEPKLNWLRFKQYLALFVEDDRFVIAAIDSLDKCYDACFEEMCEEAGVEHPSEMGRDAPALWDSIRIEFESTLGAVRDVGKSFVFLSHEKERKEETPDGGEVVRRDLSCKPAAAKLIKDICEFVMYMGYADTTVEKTKSADRVIYIRNKDNAVECGCGRPDKFLQPDGRPLYRFKLPGVAEAREENKPVHVLVAETMQQAYDNELWDYDFDPREEARKEKKRKLLKAKADAKKASLPTKRKRRTTKK